MLVISPKTKYILQDNIKNSKRYYTMCFILFNIFKFLLKNMKCSVAYVSGIVCKSTLIRSILDYQNRCQGKINREMTKISHKLINAS